MKATLIPGLEWSTWSKHLFARDHVTVLHVWREATHVAHHKAEVWRFRRDGRTLYEAYVMAGAYGVTEYLRQEFDSARAARQAVEKAVLRAIQDGAMQRN